MKKRLLLLGLLATLFNGLLYSQARFDPFTFEELIAPVLAAQRLHESVQAKVDALTEDVMELLGKNIDETLRNQLTSDYQRLERLNKNLNSNGVSAQIVSEFNGIKSSINSHIVSYNNRVAEAKKRYEAEMQKKAAEPSVWTGTGFALNNGYIVTNYHVVEEARDIKVQGIKGSFLVKYPATVVLKDVLYDIAILKIEDNAFDGFGVLPYRVKTTLSEVGEDVFVLGYPLIATMGDEIKLTTGVISSRTGFQGDVSQYQISAPVQPGNSGGPLFDKNGNVIGIVSAKHLGAENVGYAIKTSYLKSLLEKEITNNLLPQNNKISSLSLSNKVKEVKNYIFNIICSSSGDGTSTQSSSNSVKEPYASGKTYNNPIVNRNMSHNLKVESVVVQDNQTILTLSDNNRTKDGYFQWFCLDKNAYIIANGQRYTLRRAEGIALSPDKTYFSYAGETKTFRLFFPAIPQNTTSIDFVESSDSEWQLYGIQLK